VPTLDSLAALARQHGIDAATAWYYRHLRTAHASFLSDVDGGVDTPRPTKRLANILLVRGALYREQPRFGSDGRAVRAAAETLGIATTLVPIPSLGSVTVNAAVVADALEGRPDRSVVLVTLSKGGSDARIALEQRPRLAKKIRAWLNICGLIRGTPISDSLLGTRWWQRGILRGYLACTRAHPEFVRQLSSEPGTLLGSPPVFPPDLRVISVIGMPLNEHLAPNARLRHARMAALGPNDGSTLLHHAIVPGSDVYPVWGADHFMRTPDVPHILRQLLLHVERSP
jgi:hypothetical protein